MKKSKPKLTFLRRGKMVRVYHDGQYSHSITVADLVKLSNTMKDAVRVTGPVSTVVQILQEEDDGVEKCHACGNSRINCVGDPKCFAP